MIKYPSLFQKVISFTGVHVHVRTSQSLRRRPETGRVRRVDDMAGVRILEELEPMFVFVGDHL